jgi:hypothetical protein
VIVVLIYKFVIQNNGNSKSNKRFVLPAVERRVVSSFSTPAEERSVAPGLKWTRDNNLAPLEKRWVVDGKEWAPPNKKERRFQA